MQGNVNIPDSTITTNLSFRQLVLMNMQQLTNFPYIEKDFDALTDYELLCLVVKFLNDVIANQNEQNDSITRMYESFLALQTYVNNTKDTLEDAFNELDDYVRNYFDNLDVQEEINNKLDQMLEDGVLEQIIEQFLQSTALWCFDTVADMKLATNLISGSYAKTIGYYSVNDGGGATYKITNVESQTEYQEELNSNLYATLVIINNEYKLQQFGAKSDGITDSSEKINTCFSYAKDNSIIDCSGNYAINSTIILPIASNVKVKNGYFKSLSSNGYFTLASDSGTVRPYYTGYYLKIDGITLDGDYIANGLHLTKALGVSIKNSVFRNFLTFGIKIDDAESHDNVIDGCQFIGRDYSHTEVESTCLIINKPDNQVSNCVFSYAKWAVKMMTATNMITNCHFYCNDTIDGGNLYLLGGLKLISHCYFDGSGIYFHGSTNVIIDSCEFLISDRTRGNLFNFHNESTAQINGIQIINAIIGDYRTDKTQQLDLFSVDYNVSLSSGNVIDLRTCPPNIILNNPSEIFTWADSSTVAFSEIDDMEIAQINVQSNAISYHSTSGISDFYDNVKVSGNIAESHYIGADNVYRWVLIPFYVSGKASVKFKNSSGNYDGRIYNSNYEFVSSNGKFSTLTPGKYFYAIYRTTQILINK